MILREVRLEDLGRKKFKEKSIKKISTGSTRVVVLR